MRSVMNRTLLRELLALFLALIIVVTSLTTGCGAFTSEAASDGVVQEPDVSENVVAQVK